MGLAWHPQPQAFAVVGSAAMERGATSRTLDMGWRRRADRRGPWLPRWMLSVLVGGLVASPALAWRGPLDILSLPPDVAWP